MKKTFFGLCATSMALAQFTFAADPVVAPTITAYAFGGGAAIIDYGTAKGVSGIVVGQAIGEKPSFSTSTSQDSIDTRHGFWIELAAPSGTSTALTPVARLSTSISATFSSNSVALSLTMPNPSSVSVQFIDMQGRQVMTPWTGRVSAGASQLQIPLFALGTQPLFLKVQAGSAQKTYRFVPQFIN